MAYPQYNPGQNAWQVLGQALTQGGQQVGQFVDERNRLQILMQDAAAKKEAADLARIKAERDAQIQQAEEARKAAEAAQKAAEREKSDATRAELAAGKTVPGKSVGGVVGPDEVLPYSPEEANRMLLKSGDLSGKEYSATIDPTKTMEGQKTLLGIKGDIAKDVAGARAAHAEALAKYRMGEVSASAVFAAKAAMERAEISEKSKPKTDSGMPLQPLGDTELKTLKDIQNTAYSIGKIRIAANNISKLKRGPIAGRVAGKNPYDVDLQSLERLVKQTVPGMARGVFGEVGVLTDNDVERYSQMLASVKDDPALAEKILSDLEDKISSAYKTTVDTYSQGGRDVSGFSKGVDFRQLSKGDTRPAPSSKGKKSADDYLKDAGL